MKEENVHEIPKEGKMNVSGRIYASPGLMSMMEKDRTIEQVRNVACLPGILRHAYAMPDAHQGYGFPIGGVAAFDIEEGVISPGGVGYDINCSVRLLRTGFTVEEILKKRAELMDAIFDAVPAGVGRKGTVQFGREQLPDILAGGAKYIVDQGFGRKDDVEKTEEEGCMPTDINAVSDKARKRGESQVGTLGSGNHFFEIQAVDEIFSEDIAKRFGFIGKGQAVIMIHCGSRGLGHQVASDYIQKMEKKYGIKGLPDRELINAPVQSDLGQEYFSAMKAAANFGFANKQIITHLVREAFGKVMGSEDSLDVVYDVCHNIAKMENHDIDGEKREVCVHRKGATRSFGPGRQEVPESYRDIGQPVLIPGSMGTASYVLVGTKESGALSFGSTAHGAGRVLSRSQALRDYRGEDVIRDLSKKGIAVKGTSVRGIAEETYQAYKDVDEVVRVSDALGLGRLVAKLRPLGVIKG